MTELPVALAWQLDEQAKEPQWLVEHLWAEQAVGILGGEPKCCKSFLALDIAVSVASGTPCLRAFKSFRPGPVLLFPAEDSLRTVRQRLEGICTAAQLSLRTLPIHVITAPKLLLDSPEDRKRLDASIQRIQPRILILDPFIRLHACDENASKEVAPLLGFLRDLQRRHHTAVLLVHHTRKDAHNSRPGQALRGTSDLHGWGDSNLYLRKQRTQLLLSIEHRAAPAPSDLLLHLRVKEQAVALQINDEPLQQTITPNNASPQQRIITILAAAEHPLTFTTLRAKVALRAATVHAELAALLRAGLILRSKDNTFTLANKPQPLSGQTETGSVGAQPVKG